ncbi:Pyrimidodiazepine synthase [Trichoplax sp. H2]|uniref:GST N-terminal domain-containing protein n=1 Tax=Trichoplax adhaerens TaxID=10228 RepID=B3SDJ7_TRIAD|nr:hypothetical protein TRIADDRAFT_33986 [Trichoplax adhaerens]EDV19203.1 hypothetical protein TRIADDRAFT_33986 [Trichoplax adhaerens]RDD38965.1 Pyrimidodiazepine synthase [Trichoplax sp. H2]|eukprot:XP_002118323.1 hypothetical protein TRIADDRAFT_33986 [Trichoplax adhaerens]
MSFLDKSTSRPAKSSKVRLYSSRFDPYSASLRYVLRAKGIDFEDCYINLQDKPEWYNDINPTGEIPCVECGDEVIPESMIIHDYLEAKFPQVKMQRTGDAYKWSKDRLFVTRFKQNVVPKITGCLKNPNDNVDDLLAKLKKVDEILGMRGTDYIGGDKPNYADYYLFAWVEVIPSLKAAHDLKIDIHNDKAYKNYFAWVFRMDKDKHIEQDRVDRKVNFQTRTEYLKTVKAGSPNMKVGL